MNKQDHTDRQTEQRLQRYNWQADRKSERMDTHETLKHRICPYIGGGLLTDSGRAWDTEVKVNPETDDRVDLVDYGLEDEKPLAIEFESHPTEKTKTSKLERYVHSGPCRDMLLYDLRECPDRLDEIAEWISQGMNL